MSVCGVSVLKRKVLVNLFVFSLAYFVPFYVTQLLLHKHDNVDISYSKRKHIMHTY